MQGKIGIRASCLGTPGAGDWRRRVVRCCLLCAFFAGSPVNSLNAADAVTWRVGRDLQQTLDGQIGSSGLTWVGQNIRDGVANLSRSSSVRVAMLLDRRIDPETRMDLSLGDVPLEEALGRIAAAVDAGHCRVGSVVYFGPRETARRLRTVAELRKEEIRKRPAAEAKRLLQVKDFQWDDLAEPRGLLESHAAGAGLTIANLEVVPHDLWAAAELPMMTLVDRLTLLAAAYDLTFEIDESAASLRLVPIPDRVTVRRSHNAGQAAQEKAKQIAAMFPECTVAATGTKIQVDGRVEDQLMIATLLTGKEVRRPSRPPPTAAERIEVNLVATNKLGALIGAVATKLSFETEFDGAAIKRAGISLDQVVTINAQRISVPETLRRLTEPYGLEYELNGKKLTIRPKKK